MFVRHRLTFLLAVSLATAGPAIAQVSAGAANATGRLSAGSTPLLSVGEIERHIAVLASDELAGRRAGTPGAERAARYVVQRFKEAGLEPTASHLNYLQSFEFPVGVEPGPENRLVLFDGSRMVTIFSHGIDFLPLAGSVADRVDLPLVFAGYGISAPSIGYDDYDGIDVEGKVVLVLRHSPDGDEPASPFGRYLSERYKAATARHKGARAILFVNGPASEEIDRLIPFDTDENPEAMGIVAVSVTQGVARRIASLGGGDLSRWQLEIDDTGEPASRPIRDAVINLRTDVRPRMRMTHNVIGVLPGRDPARAHEAIVVGAHYDGLGLGGAGSLDPVPGAIHNGADDNASGVAALLELAQWFAYPTNRPDRSLIFVAFGAEEEGMLGSAWFVSQPPVPLEDIVAMINMDMIGRLKEEVIVYGVGSSPAWPAILEQANRGLDVPVKPMSEGYGPSDHAAFYLRRIPVLAFFTGVHLDYHRATDDLQGIDLEGTLRVTRLVSAVTEQLAIGTDRLPFDASDYRPPEIDEVLALGPGQQTVRLGAVPAPSTGNEGMIVERIMGNSPAAAAGIEPGDRIVRVEDEEIATIYDYVAAVSEMVPRRSAKITVIRDGETLELSILPRAQSYEFTPN